MKLPKDRNDWCDRHLARAQQECDRLFARYEARVDFDRREESDHLFMAYLRAEERVRDIAIVVG